MKNVSKHYNLFDALRTLLDVDYHDTLTFDGVPTVDVAAAAAAATTTYTVAHAATGEAAKKAFGEKDGSFTLFMPGCTLSTYAAALTRTVYAYLHGEQLADALLVQCCGKLLKKHGLPKEYRVYRQKFAKQLSRYGVTRIVVACPNCLTSLQQSLALAKVTGIELVALPQVLAERGLRFATNPCGATQYDERQQHDLCLLDDERQVHDLGLLHGESQPLKAPSSLGELPQRLAAANEPASTMLPLRFCVHDSCPDRRSGAFGAATRDLFAEADGVLLLEMAHNHEQAHCCGSRFTDSKESLEHCHARLGEFAQTGADYLIASCISCVNSFLRAAAPGSVYHYLELLFGIPIDWAALYTALDTLGTLTDEQRKQAAQGQEMRIFGGLYG
jgi:Fe-S oxidoreductase